MIPHRQHVVDSVHRNRIRTMMSVDDLVDGLMQRLSDEGLLVSGNLIAIVKNYNSK